MTRVYVPRDSSALSLGAESVANAISIEAARRKADVTVVRNGSRGLYWLEPMVEVETAQGRVAYGPVTVKDVASLFESDSLHGKPHALFLGLTENIPYLQKQERLTFARVIKIYFISPNNRRNHPDRANIGDASARKTHEAKA